MQVFVHYKNETRGCTLFSVFWRKSAEISKYHISDDASGCFRLRKDGRIVKIGRFWRQGWEGFFELFGNFPENDTYRRQLRKKRGAQIGVKTRFGLGKLTNSSRAGEVAPRGRLFAFSANPRRKRRFSGVLPDFGVPKTRSSGDVFKNTPNHPRTLAGHSETTIL